MFTGIVQGLCKVAATADEPSLRRLEVDLGGLAEGLQLGASVAVNGVCLTVAGLRDDRAGFKVVRETLNCTNLGALTTGQPGQHRTLLPHGRRNRRPPACGACGGRREG